MRTSNNSSFSAKLLRTAWKENNLAEFKAQLIHSNPNHISTAISLFEKSYGAIFRGEKGAFSK